MALQSAEVEELSALFAKPPDLWRTVDCGRFVADFVGAGEPAGQYLNTLLRINLEGRIRELNRVVAPIYR